LRIIDDEVELAAENPASGINLLDGELGSVDLWGASLSQNSGLVL
jgi:hypothetical protein